MKLEILSKTEMRERRGGEIITSYGCCLVDESPAAASANDTPKPEKTATVKITIMKDALGNKRVGDTIELG